MSTLSIFSILAAAIVMYRTISLVSTIDIHKFDGHPWRFVALASHCALIGAGAVAVALGAAVGAQMLLAGVSLMIIADRRRVR